MSLEETLKPCLLQAKAQKLARWILESQHAVVFTGAGISTAAGIPDYRGPQGVWVLKAKGQSVPEPNFFKIEPTASHVAVAALAQRGLVRHVVTQNIDDLHRRSGVPLQCLSELHGNFCLELCADCGAKYYRPFPVWHGLTSYAAPSWVLSPSSSAPDLSLSALSPGSGQGSLGDGERERDSLALEVGFPLEGQQRKRQRMGAPRWPSAPALCWPATDVAEKRTALPSLSQDGFVIRACRQKYEAKRHKPQGTDSLRSPNPCMTSSGSWSPSFPSLQSLAPSASLASDASSVGEACAAPPPPLETGRACERTECPGKLHRSVVLFGENLVEEALDNSIEHSEASDLAIVLGSSLSVGPACEFPANALRRGGRLVIVNLQPTPYDRRASMVVRAKCDDVMAAVAAELGLQSAVPVSPSVSGVFSPPWQEECKAGVSAQERCEAGKAHSSNPVVHNAGARQCHQGPDSEMEKPLPLGACKFTDWGTPDPQTPPRLNRARANALKRLSDSNSDGEYGGGFAEAMQGSSRLGTLGSHECHAEEEGEGGEGERGGQEERGGDVEEGGAVASPTGATAGSVSEGSEGKAETEEELLGSRDEGAEDGDVDGDDGEGPVASSPESSGGLDESMELEILSVVRRQESRTDNLEMFAENASLAGAHAERLEVFGGGHADVAVRARTGLRKESRPRVRRQDFGGVLGCLAGRASAREDGMVQDVCAEECLGEEGGSEHHDESVSRSLTLKSSRRDDLDGSMHDDGEVSGGFAGMEAQDDQEVAGNEVDMEEEKNTSEESDTNDDDEDDDDADPEWDTEEE